jgi:2-phospho-L-lactate guanylyltransferase
VTRPAWAIVPAKSLARGKSRLRPVLDDPQRAAFARGLLEHMLDVLAASPLDGILVCTDGDDVEEVAVSRGARVRRDAGESGSLARVVDAALADVASRGARTALVLMADLPRIEPADVAAVLAVLDHHDVAVVRDHLGSHTNALALSPPTAIATRFGSGDSFAEHCAAARAAGLRLAVVDNERIAFDVDHPADHASLSHGS